MSATTATGTLPFTTTVASYPADMTTGSSGRPRERGLSATQGPEEFYGNVDRAKNHFYTFELEPIENNRHWTVEQRALRKLRDGVETTNPTPEQLGEALLRRNIIVQPKTGEEAYARTQGFVADGAGNMVLITCLSEQGVPALHVGMVSHTRGGVHLYTPVKGVYKAVLNLEAASGFVEKGDTAERAQMLESQEELGLPPMKRHILSRDRPKTTAPALTSIYHTHSISWYLFNGTINELVEQSRSLTSRGDSEIKSLQQAHFMTIQDLCSLFEQEVDNRFMFSPAVEMFHYLVTTYLSCNSIADIQTLSVEEKSELAFEIPKRLSNGTGTTPKFVDTKFWEEVRNDFEQAIKSKEPSKGSRDSRL